MEPASMYLATICGVFGLWLAGDRLWTLCTAAVSRWPGDGYRSRAAASVVAAMLAFTLLRIGSAGAATLPLHERIVLESETPTPHPDPILNTFASFPLAQTVDSVNTTTHTVEPGDCLWRIARSVLSTAGETPSGASISDYWRSIYDANRELIGDNPNLIHPGQVLELPER